LSSSSKVVEKLKILTRDVATNLLDFSFRN
jgi:hypothetical protein